MIVTDKPAFNEASESSMFNLADHSSIHREYSHDYGMDSYRNIKLTSAPHALETIQEGQIAYSNDDIQRSANSIIENNSIIKSRLSSHVQDILIDIEDEQESANDYTNSPSVIRSRLARDSQFQPAAFQKDNIYYERPKTLSRSKTGSHSSSAAQSVSLAPFST